MSVILTKSCKHLVSITEISVIRCDEVIDTEKTKTAATNFNEKNAVCKTKNFYILLAFF